MCAYTPRGQNYFVWYKQKRGGMAESLIEDRHKKLYQCLQDNNGPLYVEGLLVSWDIIYIPILILMQMLLVVCLCINCAWFKGEHVLHTYNIV